MFVAVNSFAGRAIALPLPLLSLISGTFWFRLVIDWTINIMGCLDGSKKVSRTRSILLEAR